MRLLVVCLRLAHVLFFFFFNDTATTEIYTLSLHDALPIFGPGFFDDFAEIHHGHFVRHIAGDRKSTRLNSSHVEISYAVFCLKKKKLAPRATTPRETRAPLDRYGRSRSSRYGGGILHSACL